jgi:hypothetical protein
VKSNYCLLVVGREVAGIRSYGAGADTRSCGQLERSRGVMVAGRVSERQGRGFALKRKDFLYETFA